MIVKRRELTLWVGVWLGLIALAAVLLVAMTNTKAYANSTPKSVIMKRDSWAMIRKYVAPNMVGGGTHIESYTVQLNTDYLWWPDGNNVGKLAVADIVVCYIRNSGQGQLFQGVNANPFYTDANDVVNIGELAVDDDNTGYDCNTYKVPDEFRTWFRMDQNPKYFASGKVRIKFHPDDVFDFKWGGELDKPFDPYNDPNQWDSYMWIEGDYGGAGH